MLDGKSVLITGGTGSFGKQFLKTVFKRYNPSKVIIYSRDEQKQFDMANSPEFSIGEMKKNIRYFIGDVRDLQRLKLAMNNGIDIVIHAAAMKHVPITEYNPFEAVKTNIIGGQNVIDATLESGVQKVIALSTDKACAPINLYGATKLASDKLFVAANNYVGKHDIKYSVVRYGNVLGSRGSVVPFFLKKKKSGVLPITDKRMTRFNISLQEGVDFVLESLVRMWGGELFIPKIPSYRIIDLAKAVAPECSMKFLGIRPGEKIHEEMISINDANNCVEFDNYFAILPSLKLWDIKTFMKESNENGKDGKFCEYEFNYNSGTNDHFLNIDELRKLIHDLP